MSNDQSYVDWIGRSEQSTDIAEPRAVAALSALLDHTAPPWCAGELPPLGHWLCFPPLARQSDIGADGHPKRGLGGVIPPIDLPRRMWAGSRIRFLAPMPLGASIDRTTTLVSATPKHGRSGSMLFITLRHDICVGDVLAISEEQDLVYREEPKAGAAAAPVEIVSPPAFTRTFTPDPVALFRYSALTFNGHRIHYDYPYATQVEGYAGLVVHGPLTATLLLDHFLRHQSENRKEARARITGFSFRGLRPLLANAPFTLGMTPTADGAELVAIAPDGGAAMTATVTIQTQETTA